MNMYLKFEKYLSKKMTVEEAKAFEIALNSDKELMASFQEHNNVQQSLDLLLEEDVRSYISSLGSTDTKNIVSDSNTKKSAVFRVRQWAFAASILLIVGAVYVFNPEPSGLYIFIGENSDKSITNRGDSENLDLSDYDIAYLAMKDLYSSASKQNMSNARIKIRELSELAQTKRQKNQLDWYDANAELILDINQAKKSFELMANDKSHDYKEEANRITENWSFFKRLWNKLFSS